jgi:hypothetical protein
VSVTITKLIGYAVLDWGDNVAVTKVNANVVLNYPENKVTITKGNIYVVWQTPAVPAGSKKQRLQHVSC